MNMCLCVRASSVASKQGTPSERDENHQTCKLYLLLSWLLNFCFVLQLQLLLLSSFSTHFHTTEQRESESKTTHSCTWRDAKKRAKCCLISPGSDALQNCTASCTMHNAHHSGWWRKMMKGKIERNKRENKLCSRKVTLSFQLKL